jgi:hypothetical protein
MAPTKSLCFQKFQDWESQFKLYKVNCIVSNVYNNLFGIHHIFLGQLFTGDTDELSIDSLRECHIMYVVSFYLNYILFFY